MAEKFNLPMLFYINDTFDEVCGIFSFNIINPKEIIRSNRKRFKKGVIHSFEGTAENL